MTTKARQAGQRRAPRADARDVAVTYHRVSTAEQDPTLARQQLRQAARMRGLKILCELEETASGAGVDRPMLNRVLELARAGEIGWCLVWKIDRFGRSALDLLTHVQALDRAGVTFASTSQGIEIGPQAAGFLGRVPLLLMAAIAEIDRERIRENTRLGMAAARARGVHCGRPRKRPPEGTA